MKVTKLDNSCVLIVLIFVFTKIITNNFYFLLWASYPFFPPSFHQCYPLHALFFPFYLKKNWEGELCELQDNDFNIDNFQTQFVSI